jgi:hypothetical protein
MLAAAGDAAKAANGLGLLVGSSMLLLLVARVIGKPALPAAAAA